MPRYARITGSAAGLTSELDQADPVLIPVVSVRAFEHHSELGERPNDETGEHENADDNEVAEYSEDEKPKLGEAALLLTEILVSHSEDAEEKEEQSSNTLTFRSRLGLRRERRGVVRCRLAVLRLGVRIRVERAVLLRGALPWGAHASSFRSHEMTAC